MHTHTHACAHLRSVCMYIRTYIHTLRRGTISTGSRTINCNLHCKHDCQCNFHSVVKEQTMEIRSLVHVLWHAAVGAVYMLMAFVLHFCT